MSLILFSIYTDFVKSSFSNTVVHNADDTVVLGLIERDEDFTNYLSDLAMIKGLCKDNDLILTPSKTHEMNFSTQRVKPVMAPLVLDNVSIQVSSQVKYLGVLIDDKLKFSDHVNNAFIKAKQKAYVVNRFARYGANVSLTKQLFNGFIESHIFYCLIILFHHLYAKDKAKLKRPYQILKKLDIDHTDFMSILSEVL